MNNYTNQFFRALAIAACGLAAATAACSSSDYGSSSQYATACTDGSGREYGDGCIGDGSDDGSGSDGSGSDGSGSDGSGSDGSGCEYGGSGCDGGGGDTGCEYGGPGCDDNDCEYGGVGCDDGCEYGGVGCDDDCEYGGVGCDDDCTPATTTLSDLLEGLTALDCSTSTATLDAIIAELTRLTSTIDCNGDISGYCDADIAALVAAVEQLQALSISFDCTSETQNRLDQIMFLSGRLVSCGDTDIDIDDDDDDDDSPSSCSTVDWDRISPAPNIGGQCSVIALTSSAGYWDTVADIDPYAFRPGASSTAFSVWERSYNDYGWPLHPSNDLLSKFGLSSSQINFMQSVSGTHQLYTALDLRPLQFQLMMAPRIVVIYGRTNASAAYVDEGELPLNLDPGAYSEYLYLLDYEHATKRDSIKVLSCDARELIGQRALTFSSRVAIDQPWTPYIPAQPGVWAAVLSCQAPTSTTSTPTTTSIFNQGSMP